MLICVLVYVSDVWMVGGGERSFRSGREGDYMGILRWGEEGDCLVW